MVSDPKPVACLAWVRRHSTARGPARAVLLVIAAHADPDGSNAYPSTARLAEETGLSQRTVRRALRTLEGLGELVVEEPGRGHTANRYRVLMPMSTVVNKAVDNPKEIGQSDLAPRLRSVTVTGQIGQSDLLDRSECPPTVPNRPLPGGTRPTSSSARCVRHSGNPDPPPCRGCAAARELAEVDAKRYDEARAAEGREARRLEAEADRVRAASPETRSDSIKAARRAIRRRDPPIG